MPSIATQVIAGFLGAGKTTVINTILRDSDEPIAVVVNDFGSINIDASLIAAHSDDVIELTNGCICCSIGESLADALYTILDRDNLPSSIVIEASGVSDPRQISAYTHLDGLHNAGTIVLVDAANALSQYADQRMQGTFYRQILSADLLAISKRDLVTDDQYDAVARLICDIAPNTPVIDCHPELLSQAIVTPRPELPNSIAHDTFHTLVLPASSYADEETLRDELQHHAPQIIRAKGVIALENGERRLVQLVGNHIAITPTPHEVTGIVVISTD